MIVNRRTTTVWANGNCNDVDQPGRCKQKRIFGGYGLKNCCLAVNLPLEARLSLGAPSWNSWRSSSRGCFAGSDSRSSVGAEAAESDVKNR